jgi:hypothetical protein
MKPSLRWGILAACAAGVLAAGALLASADARVDRLDVLRALAAAAVLAALAGLLGPFRRRGRSVAIGLVLAASAVGAGAAVSVRRDVEKRAGALWSVLGRRAAGPAAALEARARGDREGARRALLEHFRARPRLDLRTSVPLPPEVVARESDQVLSSVFELLRGRPVRLPEDIDWGENPLADPIWPWFLHAMGYVLPLLERFRETGDARFLQKAEDLVLDWIDDNYLHLLQPAGRLAWHDHVTALRVRAWLELWEDWVRSPLAGPAEAEKLLTAIAGHAKRLVEPAHYTAGHNHGIEQDIALMAIATAFPEFEPSAAWADLACRRLEEQVRLTVSPGGVHLEHSPGYHVFVLEMLTLAHDFARRHALACARKLEATLDAMARHAAYMLRPDGRLPLIGDTDPDPPRGLDDPVLSPYAARDPVLRHALGRGAAGEPGEAAVVYPEEGYAIFRDTWSPREGFDQAFHLVFTAAAHAGRAHKQHDDLSFVLFAGGREFLVDTGLYGYDAREPERQYALSAPAHSVVLVDGKGFSGFTAKIERHALGKEYALVEASHANYPGIRHRRTLLHVRPATVFVLDRLEPRAGDGPPREREFEQLFHLAHDLEADAVADGSIVLARAPDGRSRLRIAQLAGGRGTGRIITGQRDPLQGWVSREYRKLVPAPVASFRERGREATFITWIEVERLPFDDPPDPAGGSAAEEGGRTVLRWKSGGRARTATVIPAAGEIRVEIAGSD